MAVLPNEILTVVPARGGSKGIPHKNLHPFRGRPLIDYTLNLLQELPELRHVVVSTEDEEIREHCASAGFATEYKRPTRLATDESGVSETSLHVLDWAEGFWQQRFRYVLLLQPTSPLRKARHVRAFLAELDSGEHESLVAVSPMTEHPMECIAATEGKSGWEYLVAPPSGAQGRQAYRGRYFFINGAIYAATPDFLRREGAFFVPPNTALFEMEARYSLDIDTTEDLLR